MLLFYPFFCINKYVLKFDVFSSVKDLSFLRNVKGIISLFSIGLNSAESLGTYLFCSIVSYQEMA